MRDLMCYIVGVVLMALYIGVSEYRVPEAPLACRVEDCPADTIEAVREPVNVPSKPVRSSFVTHVTLTSYNPCPEQCNEDYLHTADNTFIDMDKLKRGHVRYVAVSRDLLCFLPFGSKVHIDGLGEYEVRDLMNQRFNHCIDVLQHKDMANFKRFKVKVKRTT